MRSWDGCWATDAVRPRVSAVAGMPEGTPATVRSSHLSLDYSPLQIRRAACSNVSFLSVIARDSSCM